MDARTLTPTDLQRFAEYLYREEKSVATREKYLRDAGSFLTFAGDEPITKELTLRYKSACVAKGYAHCSINSMLAGMNSLLAFLGFQECRVKNIRLQHQAYCPEEKELTKEEYLRLLAAAEGNTRLRLVMQTICATGIRVSELAFFTVEAVSRGEVTVSCKGKIRRIFVPGKLRKLLLRYARQRGITGGAVFVTRTGRRLDRSTVWSEMKKLCQRARVAASKVFPHNLRKLFARTFYKLEKDIAKLADILGHSSINTTRIYIMSTGLEHRQKIERLELLI